MDTQIQFACFDFHRLNAWPIKRCVKCVRCPFQPFFDQQYRGAVWLGGQLFGSSEHDESGPGMPTSELNYVPQVYVIFV